MPQIIAKVSLRQRDPHVRPNRSSKFGYGEEYRSTVWLGAKPEPNRSASSIG